MASLALALFNPGWSLYMTFPCLLAATMEGALLGSLLPAPANRILHPIIVTALAINGTAAGFGLLTGVGYQATLQSYLTKVPVPLLHLGLQSIDGQQCSVICLKLHILWRGGLLLVFARCEAACSHCV